jgi:hypothetical protein
MFTSAPSAHHTTRSSWKIAGAALLAGALLFGIVASIRLTARPEGAVNAGDPQSGPSPSAQRSRGSSPAPVGPRAGTLPKLRTTAANAKYPPSALDQYRERRNAPEPIHPKDFFDAEVRNPVWAAKMEEHLRGRFSEESVKATGMSDFRLDQVECRASACQVEVSWGHGSLDHVASRPRAHELVGGNPMGYYMALTGALGNTSSRNPLLPGDMAVPGMRKTRLRSDGRFATRETVLFGADDIDPDNYRRWAEESRARLLRDRPEAAAL